MCLGDGLLNACGGSTRRNVGQLRSFGACNFFVNLNPRPLKRLCMVGVVGEYPRRSAVLS